MENRTVFVLLNLWSAHGYCGSYVSLYQTEDAARFALQDTIKREETIGDIAKWKRKTITSKPKFYEAQGQGENLGDFYKITIMEHSIRN